MNSVNTKHRHKKWNLLHLFIYHRLYYVILAVFFFIVLAGIIVVLFEKNHPLSNIHTIGNGVWWAFVTAAAVGYGDHYPVTTAGRTIAITLMFVGIALFSIITANIASFFVEKDEEKELDSLHSRIDELEEKIDKLLTIEKLKKVT